MIFAQSFVQFVHWIPTDRPLHSQYIEEKHEETRTSTKLAKEGYKCLAVPAGIVNKA